MYGNGDGGGGPLVGMLERLKRMENVDGLAKVRMGGATEFYENIERSGAELSSWKGELVSHLVQAFARLPPRIGKTHILLFY